MKAKLLTTAVLLVLGSSFFLVAATGGPQDELDLANQHFAEGSYKPALAAYHNVLAAKSRSEADRGHAALRIGRCHAKLKSWDEGLRFLAAQEQSFSEKIWQPRLLGLQASLTMEMPHWYYKKGDQISRERWIQGARYHYTFYDDVVGALKLTQRARQLWQPFIPIPANRKELSTAEVERRVDEFSRICFEGALAFEGHRNQKGGLIALQPAPAALKDYEKHNIGKDYGWDPQQWIQRAHKLATELGFPERAAYALFSEATYCNRLLGLQRQRQVKVVNGVAQFQCRFGGSPKNQEYVDWPEGKNPIRLLKKLIKNHAETKVIDEAVYVLASIQQSHGLYVQALSSTENFAKRFPKSRWRSDVAALRQEISYPVIQVENPAPVLPGQGVELKTKTRNIASLNIQVWPVDFGRLVTSSSYLRNGNVNFGKLSELTEMAKRYRSRSTVPLLSKVQKTPDQGQHRQRELVIPLDLKHKGAYLVELSGPETTFRTVVLVSEIALLRKISNEETLVFVVDANKGQPIANAEVLVRQKHQAKGLLGRYDKMTWKQGKTNTQGMFERPHEDSGGRSIYLEAFAQRGKDFAFTEVKSAYPRHKSNLKTVVYGFTDRPVYRPGQDIHFVGNLRSRRGDDYENLADQYFEVTITDPKGNKIFNKVLQADEYGAVQGNISVGEEAPLGQYRVGYKSVGRWVGSHRFRIEEYKKPEYEVTIEGPEEPVRVGDVVAATIRGEYYFGGGVTDAKVTWRVFRESYRPSFNLYEPYSWLYGRRKSRRDFGNRGRELVAQGVSRTDSEGLAKVTIETAKWRDQYPDQDHRFVVQADMTDLSRRTISGSGKILVPRRGLFAHVEPDRGFYRVGEKASFELRCQKPDGSPVESQGQVTVYRVTATREGDQIIESRQAVMTVAAQTDRKGHGLFEWQTDTPGRFALRYVTEDKWGEAVVGEEAIWVTSSDYRADDFQFKNVELITDRSEYKPGDVAFVMLSGQFDDAKVLLTVEADRRILSHQVVPLSGRTAVLSLPIQESHAPNIFIHAVTVHGNRFFEAKKEIFVPPSHRFLDVDLSFDKDVYLPGEMATLAIQSRDHQGSAIPAQFALRVMDKSITYIAQDNTTDVRKFFYGRRRAFYGDNRWNGNTVNSKQFRFGGYLWRNREWKRYRSHGMPPGFHYDIGLMSGVFSRQGLARDGDSKFSGDFLVDYEESEEQYDDAPVKNERKDGGFLGAAAAPAERMLRSSKRKRADRIPSSLALANNSPVGAAVQEPEIRENFVDLAVWRADMRTGTDGRAQLRFKLPDSLTTWVATARGLSRDTKVGMAEVEVKTTKRVLARLQAPRFFTEKDEIVVSGIVRNDYDEALDMKVKLLVNAGVLDIQDAVERTISIPGKSEKRIDWLARVQASGQAEIQLQALSAKESDAMRMNFPVLSYGIDKVVTKTAVLEGDAGVQIFPIDVPAARRVSSAELEVTLSPSLASTMLEALPYLIEYPYGCTEQTMSRFLPAVIVARTLKDMGISLDSIAKKRQALANKDLLNGGRLTPVYSDLELAQVVKSGIRRLRSMQNGNGSFGWWRFDRGSVHLTSYVVYGLAEAKKAGYSVPQNMIERAADWLTAEIPEIDSRHEQVYTAFALASAGRKPEVLLKKAFERRDDLSVLGKAQLALALHLSGQLKKAALVMTNLEDFVQVDQKNGIAYWHSGSSWWHWYGDEVECNAYVLLALAKINPKSSYIDGLSRWLVFNRSGNRWKSTRDTAISVLALSSYMKGAGELNPNYEIVVGYGNKVIKTVKVNSENMFAFDDKIFLRGDAIATGALPLRVERRGEGRLYVNCRLKYFSREDKIKASGHQVEVAREYFALTAVEKEIERGGKKIKVLEYERKKLDHMAKVEAGQEIEVKLRVTAANDYEYIMLADRKPAGFEPLALVSGRRYGNGLCSNMELRDEKVVFFVTWLQKGSHEISYKMRAEIPGTLNAMPCQVQAMYAPRLGGISDSWRVQVTDASD